MVDPSLLDIYFEKELSKYLNSKIKQQIDESKRIKICTLVNLDFKIKDSKTTGYKIKFKLNPILEEK